MPHAARLALTTLLAGTAVTGGLTVSAPARADEVAVAQARVDRLQALVVTTTRTLTEGTRQWEDDRTALAAVTLRLRNLRGHVAAEQRTAALGQERVSSLARRLYMTGGTGPVQVAFSQGPDEVLGALSTRQALAQVAGSDAEVVRRATATRVRLQSDQAGVQQLADQARLLVHRAASRLTELDALAQSTSDQLTAAQDALARARAARAVHERAVREAARRVAAARLTAARSAAARAAADRDAAALVTVPAQMAATAGGTACSGRPTTGQQNGNLDPASLCPLWSAPGHRLRGDAARAFEALSRHHAATAGGPLCVTDSYRSYSAQVDVYRRKPGLAAVPGTSEHGWGLAVDFCGGIQDSGSAASAWMRANAGRFGWFHPSWAEPAGGRPEPWHWEFQD